MEEFVKLTTELPYKLDEEITDEPFKTAKVPRKLSFNMQCFVGRYLALDTYNARQMINCSFKKLIVHLNIPL